MVSCQAILGMTLVTNSRVLVNIRSRGESGNVQGIVSGSFQIIRDEVDLKGDRGFQISVTRCVPLHSRKGSLFILISEQGDASGQTIYAQNKRMYFDTL